MDHSSLIVCGEWLRVLGSHASKTGPRMTICTYLPYLHGSAVALSEDSEETGFLASHVECKQGHMRMSDLEGLSQ